MTTEPRPRLVGIFKKICEEKGCEFKNIKDIKDIRDISPNELLTSVICKELGIRMKAVKKGIKNTALPCRFEMIQKNPMVILDGSHNEDKIKFLLENLKKMEYKNLYLIFTLKDGKDVRKIVKQFTDLKMKKVYATRHTVPGVSCVDLKYLYNEFLDIAKLKYNKNKSVGVGIEIDPWRALGKALEQAEKDDLILITGSFYLAGELRKKWVSEEAILKNN